jgi:hypothetical protein
MNLKKKDFKTIPDCIASLKEDLEELKEEVEENEIKEIEKKGSKYISWQRTSKTDKN